MGDLPDQDYSLEVKKTKKGKQGTVDRLCRLVTEVRVLHRVQLRSARSVVQGQFPPQGASTPQSSRLGLRCLGPHLFKHKPSTSSPLPEWLRMALVDMCVRVDPSRAPSIQTWLHCAANLLLSLVRAFLGAWLGPLPVRGTPSGPAPLLPHKLSATSPPPCRQGMGHREGCQGGCKEESK